MGTGGNQSGIKTKVIDFFGRHNRDFFSKAVILLFMLLMLVFQLLQENKPMGESANYMASAIALESRFSIQITQADIDLASEEFPSHGDSIQWHWQSKRFVKDAIDGSRRFSWYFPTYSALCIPAIKLLRLIGFDRAYAFPVTNVLLYAAALFYVFKRLEADRGTVFFTILFLACSPAVAYLWWASAEVCIFAFVTMAAVNLLSGRHKHAAFYISLGGTLNIAVMVVGIAVILDYFWKHFEETGFGKAKDMIKALSAKITDILKLAACYLPFIISTAFNLFTFHALTPTSRFGDTKGWGGRFLAYIFDLNLGFLPYFNIALIFFFIMIIYGLLKLRREAFVFMLAFFGTIAIFALEAHINTGMTGISRYCAWLSPVMVLYVCTQTPVLFKESLFPQRLFREQLFPKRLFAGLAGLAVALTAVTSAYTLTKPSSLLLTPMARTVLTYAPALYNPYKHIFTARVARTDQGYYDLWTHPEPVMYLAPDGYVRKILVPAGFDRNRVWFEGSREYVDALMNKMEAVGSREYIYINVSRSWKILPKGS